MKFELYKMYEPPATTGAKRRARWAWRLRADNGRVVAHHNQGYNSRKEMIEMLRKIFRESSVEEDLEQAIAKDVVEVAPRGQDL